MEKVVIITKAVGVNSPDYTKTITYSGENNGAIKGKILNASSVIAVNDGMLITTTTLLIEETTSGVSK